MPTILLIFLISALICQQPLLINARVVEHDGISVMVDDAVTSRVRRPDAGSPATPSPVVVPASLPPSTTITSNASVATTITPNASVATTITPNVSVATTITPNVSVATTITPNASLFGSDNALATSLTDADLPLAASASDAALVDSLAKKGSVAVQAPTDPQSVSGILSVIRSAKNESNPTSKQLASTTATGNASASRGYLRRGKPIDGKNNDHRPSAISIVEEDLLIVPLPNGGEAIAYDLSAVDQHGRAYQAGLRSVPGLKPVLFESHPGVNPDTRLDFPHTGVDVGQGPFAVDDLARSDSTDGWRGLQSALLQAPGPLSSGNEWRDLSSPLQTSDLRNEWRGLPLQSQQGTGQSLSPGLKATGQDFDDQIVGLIPNFQAIGQGQNLGVTPDLQAAGQGQGFSFTPGLHGIGQDRGFPILQGTQQGQDLGFIPGLQGIGQGQDLGVAPTLQGTGQGQDLGVTSGLHGIDQDQGLGVAPTLQGTGQGQDLGFTSGLHQGQSLGLTPDLQATIQGEDLGFTPDLHGIGHDQGLGFIPDLQATRQSLGVRSGSEKGAGQDALGRPAGRHFVHIRDDAPPQIEQDWQRGDSHGEHQFKKAPSHQGNHGEHTQKKERRPTIRKHDQEWRCLETTVRVTNWSEKLVCPPGLMISSFGLASLGTPQGTCADSGQRQPGLCHVDLSESLQSHCIGLPVCDMVSIGAADLPAHCPGQEAARVLVEYQCAPWVSKPMKKNSTLDYCQQVQNNGTLKCPKDQVVLGFGFGFYGEIDGSCSKGISPGICSRNIMTDLTTQCVGHNECQVNVTAQRFGSMACATNQTALSLATNFKCGSMAELATSKTGNQSYAGMGSTNLQFAKGNGARSASMMGALMAIIGIIFVMI